MSRHQYPIQPTFDTSRPEDFLTPEQRLDAIADVLAEITLESLDKQRDQ